jgi:hypothetical protein
MKIFTVDVANDCQCVLPGAGVPAVTGLRFNEKRLLRDWKTYRYDFFEPANKKSKKPDMSTVSGGGLALRADLKDRIFSTPDDDLEFLPIRVATEDWYIVNCLRSTGAIDEEASVLYRSIEGQIFMIIKVVVDDPLLEQRDIFVLDGSNRASVLALPSFVERVSSLDISGITFREIGEFKKRRDRSPAKRVQQKRR